MLISIVIPSKNEELGIGRCITSVIAAVKDLNGIEILLVDCASTDRTVAIAKEYPVNILQLKPDWRHTAAAARYIGSLSATGEFIFFLDADMTLEKGFLPKAVDILNRYKDAAGASGIGKEIFLSGCEERINTTNLYRTKNVVNKVNFLGGAALYKKTALREVRGFNPYLNASEENDLGYRLRVKGYSLISLPYPMITHYTADIASWKEFLRKKKTNLYSGIGEAIRASHSTPYLIETLQYYKEFSFFLTYILFILAVTGCAVISRTWGYLFSLPLPMLFSFLFLVIKKKNIRTALTSLFKWHIISFEIIKGYLRRPKDPCNYPTEPLIIKKVSND